ncbi:hypothetical protein C2845_PM05G06930 [Panicum miliaceum]|uniref:VWFA domain-containing protein n=1 Tax=Panicum miliaceum TaxID=4540 RepID=A0A3L6SZY1_PANMI|nr:hypothetical protein C2845_PM05G06930 [Panicum miliaceum]
MPGLGEPSSSRICRSTTLVKLQQFTGAGAVPCAQTREKFPVLVRVTAAAAAPEESSVVGVDIVAVLDVGGGMSGAKLQRIKDAMKVVVNKLGPDERLSIVSFDTDVRRLTELTGMSDQGRIAARNVINGLSTNGGANTGPRAASPALDEGGQILRERRHDEKSNPVGCIVFLSDATSQYTPWPSGADHDPKAMKHIADKTSGTYSFANNDLGKVKDACALFTSVPATSVEITLRAHEGALISSDEKIGSDDGGRSAAIRIDNMYAGEKKNFIVYLALQTTKEVKQKLLTIGGRYLNLSDSKYLADTDVSVMRPEEQFSKTGQAALNVPHGAEVAARTKNLADTGVSVMRPEEKYSKVPHYWAEVVAGIKLFFMGISSLVPQPSTATTQAITSKLQQIWQHFCKSTEGKFKNAPQTLENFNQNMTKGINKCGEGHGCGRDTSRESALVAKILDIIITSVQEKEMELKALLVEAQYDHK